jgi:hypothetical protein
MRERSQFDLDQLVKTDKSTGSSGESNNFRLFKVWGIEIRSITIDFNLPEEVVAQRNLVLAADKDLEVARIAGQTAIVNANIQLKVAEIKRQSTLLDGQGEGAAIAAIVKTVTETGLSNQDILAYLQKIRFYKAITPNKGVIISSQADEAAAFGARVAAGSQLAKESLEDGGASATQITGEE